MEVVQPVSVCPGHNTNLPVRDQITWWVELEDGRTMVPPVGGQPCRLPSCKNVVAGVDGVRAPTRWCQEHDSIATECWNQLRERQRDANKRAYDDWVCIQATSFVNGFGANKDIAKIVVEMLKAKHGLVQ